MLWLGDTNYLTYHRCCRPLLCICVQGHTNTHTHTSLACSGPLSTSRQSKAIWDVLLHKVTCLGLCFSAFYPSCMWMLPPITAVFEHRLHNITDCNQVSCGCHGIFGFLLFQAFCLRQNLRVSGQGFIISMRFNLVKEMSVLWMSLLPWWARLVGLVGFKRKGCNFFLNAVESYVVSLAMLSAEWLVWCWT